MPARSRCKCLALLRVRAITLGTRRVPMAARCLNMGSPRMTAHGRCSLQNSVLLVFVIDPLGTPMRGILVS